MARNVHTITKTQAAEMDRDFRLGRGDFAKQTNYGYQICTLSADGIPTESGEQNLDCLLKDPEMQALANELQKPVTLTCEAVGLTKTWQPN